MYVVLFRILFIYTDYMGATDVNVLGVECFELFKMVYDNRFTMAIRFIVIQVCLVYIYSIVIESFHGWECE